MQKLESERGQGRDDYPVRAVWNSILAGIVYQHPSIESLRKELMRNAELRQLYAWVFPDYMWKTIYRKRSAVERVNSRLDESFGFEKHFIRGIKKMKLRCCLALMVILAMAYGRVKEKQTKHIRSLVHPAA